MIGAAVLFLALWIVPASAQTKPTEDDVMHDIREGLKAWDAAKLDRKRLADLKDSDPERWYDKLVEVEGKEKDAYGYFDGALRKGAALHGIQPKAGMSFGDGAEAQQGPMGAQPGKLGGVMIWKPEVLTEEKRDVVIKFEGADGKAHYALLSKKRIKEDSGDTWSNGRVTIPLKTLRRCVADGNTGELAYALDHESFHFWDKTAGAEVSRAFSEVEAFSYGLARSSLYPGGGWEKFLTKQRDIWQAKVTAGDTQSVYPTPDQELELKGLYSGQERELKRIKSEEDSLKRSVELGRDLRLVSTLAQKACDGGINAEEVTWYNLPPEAYQAEHDARGTTPAEGLADCAEALSRDILEQLAYDGWTTSTLINQLAKTRRNQAAWITLQKDAARCDFDLVRQGAAILGVTERSGDLPWHPFVFQNPGDLETVKVSMLMANACLLVTKYERNMNEPGWNPICNRESFAILNQRLNDPLLRDFLTGTLSQKDGDNAQARCMWDLRDALRQPVTEQSFGKALMHAHKEHEKDLKVRERDARETAQRNQRNRDIERRNKEIEERNERIRERGERGGGRGGCTVHGIWYPQCY